MSISRTSKFTVALAIATGTLLATAGVAEATSARGAVLLRGDSDVIVEGGITTAAPQHDVFWHWEGDTLFAGATDPSTGNQVEILAEFYWFETSLDRNSDFYSVVLKVKTSPNASEGWGLEVDPGDAWYRPSSDYKPCMEVVATTNPSGAGGGIRWDWAVPFTDYRWDPMRTVEIEQGYSLGVDSEGTVMSEVKNDGTKAKILGKGTFDWSRKVSTNYSITLYAWQMLVAGGAERQSWQLALSEGDRADQSAYHEYFLILQSNRGTPAILEGLEAVGTFRKERFLAPDENRVLSAMLRDIVIHPPSDEDRADSDRRAGDVTGSADDGGSGRATGGNAVGGNSIAGALTSASFSEIFFDAPGRDEGTFVELMGPPAASLDGITLVGVGGNNGEEYVTIPLDGMRFNDDGLFVIAQDDTVPGAGLIDSKINLKNGPDNVLLVSDREVLDAVGYGGFEAGHYFAGEGSPAATEPGMAIGRVGLVDTNDNGADFIVLTGPTPGAWNAPGMRPSAGTPAAGGPGLSPQCLRSSDCAGSQVCSPLGTCIDECRTNKDCVTGYSCSAGTCRGDANAGSGGSECLRNSDCAESRICSPTGTCINECVTDRDCNGSACLGGTCDRTGGFGSSVECELNSDCGGNEICNPLGSCISECRADRDCPAAFSCQTGTCAPGTNDAVYQAGVQSNGGSCAQGGAPASDALTLLIALGGIVLIRRRRLS